MAGRLPGLMKSVLHLSGTVEPLRWALVAASCVVALGALAAAGLRFQSVSRIEARTYPRARVVAGFLIALSCWSAATGAFNPFFNGTRPVNPCRCQPRAAPVSRAYAETGVQLAGNS